MVSIILIILIILLAVILLCALCIVVVPFTISFLFKMDGPVQFFTLEAYWLHPGVAGLLIDPQQRTFRLRILNRTSTHSLKNDNGRTGGSDQEKESAPAGPEEGPQGPEERFSRQGPAGAAVEEEMEGNSQKEAPGSLAATAPRAEDEKQGDRGIFGKIKGGIESIRRLLSNRLVFFIRHAAWRGEMQRWMKRLFFSPFRIFRVHRIRMHLRGSLGDPATTGQAYGYWVGAMNALSLHGKGGNRFSFEPVFNQEGFQIDGELSLRTSLARCAWSLVLIAATFPYISTYKIVRQSKKLEKEKPGGKKS